MKVEVSPSVISGRVRAPPSKSYTHRAIMLASLSEGRSTVENILLARDTVATIQACRALGAEMSLDVRTTVEGALPLRVPDDVINVENSGTTLRLIAGAASLVPEGYSVLTGDDSVRRRPMQPLLDSLRDLGVRCWSTRSNGCAPIVVEGGGMYGGRTSMAGGVSSQFLSSLLISTPLAESETHIQIEGRLVSRPYVEATLEVIRRFGGRVEGGEGGVYRVPPKQRYTATSFRVPGDFSSASFIFAAAALTGGEVYVDGLDFTLPQGDAEILNILKRMGVDVTVEADEGRVRVRGTGRLKGGEFDLSDTPDLLPVLAVLASRSSDDVLIRGVKHARFKETDRISVLAEELPKLGLKVEELEDGLKLRGGGRLERCVLDAHGDHRMAMIFCIVSLASEEGCTVEGFESIDVSYPGFKEDIIKLGGAVEEVGR